MVKEQSCSNQSRKSHGFIIHQSDLECYWRRCNGVNWSVKCHGLFHLPCVLCIFFFHWSSSASWFVFVLAVTYENAIVAEEKLVKDFRRDEELRLPTDLDYRQLSGYSFSSSVFFVWMFAFTLVLWPATLLSPYRCSKERGCPMQQCSRVQFAIV